ncbi:nucleoside-diphosphate sugar epimerase [Legionella busanensis]|uniref:Nucleoside-diphosphate sugar epimerase n=1 Tax=Legionella busanensis TaxID=190655 RepID=A0A378JJG4_9GAMM|nr:TIGR01777 family oxidoreductase [Legionella busanensis]STX50359.1 nucleoside-diphosphate sugar epimerase [Legionella busanensis]
MNILIAGGTGFIGRELINALKHKYTITVLGRNQAKLKATFPDLPHLTWADLPEHSAQSYDSVINLSGYNIAASRWSPKVKQEIISSRVDTTTDLINWIINTQAKPRFFVANAVGIYGAEAHHDETGFDEDTVIDRQHPKDFLSEIGIKWEQALQPALDYGLESVITRFGVVLKRGEGILKKLEFSFKLGLGSVIGEGQQIMSWVHINDVIAAFLFLFDHSNLKGTFNVTSPNPITQKEFAQALAKSMHRPLMLKMPAPIVKLLFGEMGDYLLLRGQRVLPKRLLEAGFKFNHPYIDEALQVN